MTREHGPMLENQQIFLFFVNLGMHIYHHHPNWNDISRHLRRFALPDHVRHSLNWQGPGAFCFVNEWCCWFQCLKTVVGLPKWCELYFRESLKIWGPSELARGLLSNWHDIWRLSEKTLKIVWFIGCKATCHQIPLVLPRVLPTPPHKGEVTWQQL